MNARTLDKAGGMGISSFLNLFYPACCRISSAIDDVIRGELTSVQAYILWSFGPHVTGRLQPTLRRKEVAAKVKGSFDITNAAISQAILGMTRPPLNLVRLVRDSASGRQKLICLTSGGASFIEAMARRGNAYFEEIEIAFERTAASRNRIRRDFMHCGIKFVHRRAGPNKFTGQTSSEMSNYVLTRCKSTDAVAFI